jgi:hypothetical protein
MSTKCSDLIDVFIRYDPHHLWFYYIEEKDELITDLPSYEAAMVAVELSGYNPVKLGGPKNEFDKKE